jgi:hypothetical protein
MFSAACVLSLHDNVSTESIAPSVLVVSSRPATVMSQILTNTAGHADNNPQVRLLDACNLLDISRTIVLASMQSVHQLQLL